MDGAGDDGWVLHRAESGLGSWLSWSATGHTLLLGSLFAVLFALLVEQLALPAGLRDALRLAGLGVASAAWLPLGVLVMRHRARRVRAVRIDPAGLTLLLGTGREHRVEFTDLASVRTRAEPVFGQREAGRIGGFVGSVQLVDASGATWEFAAARMDDLLAVLAWMQVLAPASVPLPPSVLAAKHRADDATRNAQRWLLAALGAASVCVALQAARFARAAPGIAPGLLLGVSVLAIGAACALYVLSFRAQVDAGRLWLMARGLSTGPPVTVPA